DGIRDLTVTGVQTCALPISKRLSLRANGSGLWPARWQAPRSNLASLCARPRGGDCFVALRAPRNDNMCRRYKRTQAFLAAAFLQIGRASCRERGEMAVVAAV